MDHLNFDRVKIEDRERRKRKGFGVDIPSKNYTTHGSYIEKSIDNNINAISEKSKKLGFNPYLVLKIELEDGVSFQDGEEEKLELFGLKIIDKESNQIQVVFSEDIDLAIFKEELEKYKTGQIAVTKIKNEDLFCKIKSVSEWSREDRIALDLEKIKDGSYIDIYLWVFETIDISKQKMTEFSRYISNNAGRVCDSYVGQSVVVARVQLRGDILEKILEHPLVYKVEDITRISVINRDISNIKNISIDEIEYDNNYLNPDKSTSICVIDSGVFQQHPLFNGVIGDSKTFYLNDELEDNSDDISGHGTKVASICAYGDFKYNQKFIPQIYIHNAKIHNGQYEDVDNLWKNEVEKQIGNFTFENIDAFMEYQDGAIDFDTLLQSFEEGKRPYLKMVYSKYASMYEKLIPTQMRQIVEYFYDNYDCRIYNLSQGDGESAYNGGKPKAWACVLDELQNEYDINFVVSSGNYCYEEKNNFESILDEYPRYFYNSNACKIIEPANSVSSITVGAIATAEDVYNSLERLNKVPISKQGQISSITRVGPGVGNSIKPDFIAYGGDRGIEIDFSGRKRPINNIGLSKLLFNNDNSGLYAWDVGTSFAAPYVSYIIGKILNKYPKSSNNLVRAILASSSRFPAQIISAVEQVIGSGHCYNDEFKYRGNNNYAKVLHYTAGYGFPSLENCTDSLENRVVLMADINKEEDLLKIDTMHVFSIPLPEEFRKANGKKRVVVSLAFNPKVKNTRLDYMGVSMNYKLIKGLSREAVIEIYESQKGKSETINIQPRYECNLEPGTTIRSKGTLQKSVFEFTKDSNFNGQDLFLVVNAKKEWDETPQKYAVVVALESEDESLEMYNTVKNRLEQRVQARSRV
ncbi:S8 family peptidase [Haloimpatiens massiliensis]|uniref:S8 family peptidase n=1 Tax=Haloimpatiens massiliensis TaxID=1658110 RepID=UPI000C82B750|nr:S8 family peptidase [Haloimpatiens massiliensis]